MQIKLIILYKIMAKAKENSVCVFFSLGEHCEILVLISKDTFSKWRTSKESWHFKTKFFIFLSLNFPFDNELLLFYQFKLIQWEIITDSKSFLSSQLYHLYEFFLNLLFWKILLKNVYLSWFILWNSNHFMFSRSFHLPIFLIFLGPIPGIRQQTVHLRVQQKVQRVPQKER